MTDYYPLIARAVTGLDKGTGEARRALYERARTALVGQLRGVEPALTEAHITRERLALEEAIRKVEAEAARRPRQQSPEFSRANLAAPRPESPDREAVAPAKPPPEPSGDEPPPEPSGNEPPLPFEPPSQPDHAAPGGPAPAFLRNRAAMAARTAVVARPGLAPAAVLPAPPARGQALPCPPAAPVMRDCRAPFATRPNPAAASRRV